MWKIIVKYKNVYFKVLCLLFLIKDNAKQNKEKKKKVETLAVQGKNWVV